MKIAYRIMNQPANSGDQKRAEWVSKMMPGAEPTAAKLGISPEAIVAQAALETGWGKAAIGNNVFGIKASPGWKGKTQDVATWEDRNGPEPGGVVNIIDRFRDYPTVADSFADHFKFLEENSRYRNAGVFAKQGDNAYFMALQRAGYATDPAYAAKLSSILNTVTGYTARMERVELGVPAGYEVTPTGNVVNPNPADSSIIKDAGKSDIANMANTAVGVLGPFIALFAGLDWKVVGIVVVAALIAGGAVYFSNRRVKKARLDMSRQGVV